MDFEIVKNINITKRREVLDSVREKDYQPFLVNRALSYFPDTVLQANAMNLRSFLDKQTQYDYLMCSTRKRNRFAKWTKVQQLKDLKMVCDILECSPREGAIYIEMLTESQLEEMRGFYGGTRKQ
jgi:hypothetical protein